MLGYRFCYANSIATGSPIAQFYWYNMQFFSSPAMKQARPLPDRGGLACPVRKTPQTPPGPNPPSAAFKARNSTVLARPPRTCLVGAHAPNNIFLFPIWLFFLFFVIKRKRTPDAEWRPAKPLAFFKGFSTLRSSMCRRMRLRLCLPLPVPQRSIRLSLHEQKWLITPLTTRRDLIYLRRYYIATTLTMVLTRRGGTSVKNTKKNLTHK